MPNFIHFISGVKRGTSIPSLLVFTVTAPIQATIGAAFCTEKCPESGRNVEANFRGGLPTITGSLTLNIGSFNRNWQLFKISVYEYANRYNPRYNNLFLTNATNNFGCFC